jgi:Fic family protein
VKYADTDISVSDSLLEKIESKKKKLDSLRPLPNDAVQRILEDIRLRHTYHSDAIEGNTLSLQETKLVLEEGVAIGGKPLKDHIEARNDAEAFDLMLKLATSNEKISPESIQKIHEYVMRGILLKPGQYRTENVAITGALNRPPSYLKIVSLMDEYFRSIEKMQLHPVKKAAYIHYEFVRIHPFIDGNGRVARLLTNFYLIKKGYPPIIIQKEERKTYYRSLHRADQGDLSTFAMFIAFHVNESLQYYLSSFIDEERLEPLSELSKTSKYSQEYLSLRARQGKLDAVKIEKVWYSSKQALLEYQKSINNKRRFT